MLAHTSILLVLRVPFNFSDASRTICASEAPLLSSIGGFSRRRQGPSTQTTSHRPSLPPFRCGTSSDSRLGKCPGAQTASRRPSSLPRCGHSSTASQPCGPCRGRKYLPKSSFACRVPGSSGGLSDHRGHKAAATASLWCPHPAAGRPLADRASPACPPRSNTANQASATVEPAGSAPANQAPAPVQPTGPQDHTEIPVVGNPVQQVVTSLQSNLSGEQGLFPSLPQDPFTYINLPVDARVAMKLKTKIWQQDYIDFGSLLVNPTLDGKFQLTIQNSNEGLSPFLALEPLNKPPKISSIEMWLQAFHVFVGIYAGRYPNEATGLKKYGSTIQDLAARGHNWRFYDENFRFLRQSQATSLPWGTVHWELWLRSQSNLKKPSTSFTGSKPVSSISIPRGYCFKFHRGGDCAGCSFKHTCCKCEGAHRALHCNFRGFRGNPRISSQVRGADKSNSIATLPQANSTTLANSRKS